MITENTLFILGAGASKIFGYPSGEELKNYVHDYIMETWSAYNQKRPIPVILQNKFTETQRSAFDFAEKIKGTSSPSIDIFLNNHLNHKDWNWFGKYFIAMSIGCVQPKIDLALKKVKPTGDEIDDYWFDYLFKEMLSGANSVSSFMSNRAKFITFNYDFSLEIAFNTALENCYPKEQIIDSMLHNFEIWHPYGVIKPTHIDNNLGKLYHSFESIMNDIKLIFEAEEKKRN